MDQFNGSNGTLIGLPFFACLFLDLPITGMNCSEGNDSISICVRCLTPAKFLGSESTGTGHVVTQLLGFLTMIIGLFGLILNVLVLAIMRKQKKTGKFEIFLRGLVWLDMIASVGSITAAITVLAIFENWSRSPLVQFLAYFSTFLSYFGRTGSYLMTALMTAQRCTVISFPINSRSWITLSKARRLTLCLILLALFVAVPRFMSYFIYANPFQNIPSLSQPSYLILPTKMEPFWYGTLWGFFDKIDFFVPIPLLLILNIVFLIQLRKVGEKRKEMNLKRHTVELHPVKITLPPIITVTLCNLGPVVYYCHVSFGEGVAYKELFLGVFLSVTLNSALNTFIYCLNMRKFRDPVEQLLQSYPSPFALIGNRERLVSDTGTVVIDGFVLYI